MAKDTWTLNNCKKYAGRGYFIGDVEILRKKIIGDVATYCDSEIVILFDIIDIINKRFGFEK